MSNVWKTFHEKMGNRKTHGKRHKPILVPSQRYQDSRHLLLTKSKNSLERYGLQ